MSWSADSRKLKLIMNKFFTVSCIFFYLSVLNLQACQSEDGRRDWLKYIKSAVEVSKPRINFIKKNKKEAGKTPLRGKIPVLTEDQLYAQYIINQIQNMQKKSNERFLSRSKKQSPLEAMQ